MTKIGDRVRSRRSGVVGKVTEIIEIERGHQIEPPRPGDTSENQETGTYEPRTDYRVEYEDDDGNVIGEQLVHADDAVSP